MANNMWEEAMKNCEKCWKKHLEQAEKLVDSEELSRMGSGPAVYYRFSDLKVPVGFISAIHGKFCDTCNRVRLTAEGYLKLCLCYDQA